MTKSSKAIQESQQILDQNTTIPSGPNVGPSAQEHLAAQGVLMGSASENTELQTITPTESQLDDAIENSFPASDPIATTSEKVAKP